MTIPGSNLLNAAHRVIKRQSAEYLRSTGRSKNLQGHWVTQYSDPVTIRGSVQAVPRTLYQTLGLDLQKNYIMIYSTMSIKDVGRGESPDRVRYNGNLFTAVSANDWIPIDGWAGVMFVQVDQG